MSSLLICGYQDELEIEEIQKVLYHFTSSGANSDRAAIRGVNVFDTSPDLVYNHASGSSTIRRTEGSGANVKAVVSSGRVSYSLEETRFLSKTWFLGSS